MKERPILFSGDMVRAILEGRKTQTRRVIKPQPPAGNYRYDGFGDVEKDMEDADPECHWLEVLDEDGEYAERYWKAGKCPYGVPGDRLFVRETFCDEYTLCPGVKCPDGPCYKATDDGDCGNPLNKWRPSIHMPRSASRITLEVTVVRAERLQDISEEDAKAEGIQRSMLSWKQSFREYWDSLAKPGAKWSGNPWVWLIEFRRVEE